MIVEVEVDSLPQLDDVLPRHPDIVLLDNMAPRSCGRPWPAAMMLRSSCQVEASGGVTLETIRAIAETGVDRISVGALHALGHVPGRGTRLAVRCPNRDHGGWHRADGHEDGISACGPRVNQTFPARHPRAHPDADCARQTGDCQNLSPWHCQCGNFTIETITASVLFQFQIETRLQVQPAPFPWCCSYHPDFHRNVDAVLPLFRGQVVQPFEADDPTPPILYEDNIVIGFFTDVFLFRVVEPDTQRVACAVVVDSQLVHSSLPFLMFLV